MKNIIIAVALILSFVIIYSLIGNTEAPKTTEENFIYIDTEPMETFVPEEPSYLREAEEAESNSFRPSISVDQIPQ